MMARGIRKYLTFIICQIAFEIFGNNTQALVISKRLKLPWDDQTDTKFYSAAWNDFLRSKSTLNSLKSVFNVFRRKLSLGAAVPLTISLNFMKFSSPSFNDLI